MKIFSIEVDENIYGDAESRISLCINKEVKAFTITYEYRYSTWEGDMSNWQRHDEKQINIPYKNIKDIIRGLLKKERYYNV